SLGRQAGGPQHGRRRVPEPPGGNRADHPHQLWGYVRPVSGGRRRVRQPGHPGGRTDDGVGHLAPERACSYYQCSAAPWCSGLTCPPVKVEIGGSNPLGVAISATNRNPPSGGFRLYLLPATRCPPKRMTS